MGRAFTTRSEQESVRAGELLAPLLRPGDVVALAGDLGAGKTQIVKGVARGLGAGEPVTSPTFNLLLVHPGVLPLYHFDLYRLEREEDLDVLGAALDVLGLVVPLQALDVLPGLLARLVA
jgi:tRNA threonylcarbamoyladenosine biosynthesis protein TsaE